MDILRYLRPFTVLLVLLFTVGCTVGSGSSLPVLPLNLNLYLTATHAVTPSSPVLPTDIPVPTPTPSTYTIAGGDTLSSIAERFGIRLDDLLAANPGIVPEALSVGQILKVPAASSETTGAPETIPVPAEVAPVQCYPAGADAGVYCLAPVHNPFPDALENIRLQITLLDSGGQSLASQTAFLPLNILSPGSTLPAYAYFPSRPTLAAGYHATARLVTSLRLASGDARYLPVVVRNMLVTVDWNGRSAQVQGQIFLPLESQPAGAVPQKSAGTVWLAAVAYDTDGQVVGFRRWEWQGNLQPGNLQSFVFFIYSFGSVIEKVDIAVEARR
jgi:murein DD-endopeptidase MepM/ murein hydrolase activator NlpD